MAIEIPKICPYCGHEVVKTTNAEIYGRDYGKYPAIYLCRNCKASVGTHPSGKPLGIMANEEIKQLRMKAHSMFDPYWKERGWRRQTAYKKLAQKLNIPASECHFSHFSKAQLEEAIFILQTIGLW